ncbi:MAG: lecithin retinol acyltransferase family protein [Sphaerospermopsis kisseleviana]
MFWNQRRKKDVFITTESGQQISLQRGDEITADFGDGTGQQHHGIYTGTKGPEGIPMVVHRSRPKDKPEPGVVDGIAVGSIFQRIPFMLTPIGLVAGIIPAARIAIEPTSKNKPTVKETSLPDFAQGRNLNVVKRNSGDFDLETTAQLAEMQVGETGYNPISLNCEHFTNYCRTGKSHSSQVAKIGWRVALRRIVGL